MIARIFILIILAIVLPDLYFDQLYWRRRYRLRLWHRLLWWLPGLVMLVYTIGLATIRDFVPEDLRVINVYLFIVGMLVIPKALFALCSGLGLLWCRWRHTHQNWGNVVAVVLIFYTWFVVIYGSVWGCARLRVHRLELYFDDLPAAFDGYRIVQISDLHVGSFRGDRLRYLQRNIDSINAQKADLIVFTGDLQNIRPSEIGPVAPLLRQLKARDGIISILGNHDYAKYINEGPVVARRNETVTRAWERRLGWQLLCNEHVKLYRDHDGRRLNVVTGHTGKGLPTGGLDSIVIAGEENYKKPSRSDLGRTLRGVGRDAFVVLLQHQPEAWPKEILPTRRVALTLSGHTHGGQMSYLGLRPTHILPGSLDYGLYERDGKRLYVNAGLGGLVFFRFNMPAEITVFTLRSQQSIKSARH